MSEDIKPSIGAERLFSLLAAYLQGAIALDEIVVAVKAFPPAPYDDQLLGIDLSFLDDTAKSRMQTLVDALAAHPPDAA